jgi:hypothetical protein
MGAGVMSSATFDPNKIKVEDLFRAKEERRQVLARLPFEEKIKIVKKLQTSVSAAMKNEKLIFESFLRVCPDFASEPIREWDVVDEWYAKRALAPPAQPFDKRPDVIARTTSGKRVGVELKSWVNRDQITEARKQERIRENILKAIGAQSRNQTQYIGYVRLAAKQDRFDPRDSADFRKQMFGLIEQADNSWPQNEYLRDHEYPGDLAAFPILEKYLTSVRFEPATSRHPDSEWIGFPSPGGAYSPHEMLETLSRSLAAHKNDERYKDLRNHVDLDDVYLLVHYDFKAFAYNTPFAAPDFGFKEAAEFASRALEGNGGYFDRIFLFHFLWGEEEAYRLL